MRLYLKFDERVYQIKRLHANLGHMKADSIVDLISRRYWMSTWVKEYINSCPKCQLSGNYAEDIRPIKPIPPVALPFERWGIDFIQDLSETKAGNKNIITAIDYATKWVKWLSECTLCLPNRSLV